MRRSPSAALLTTIDPLPYPRRLATLARQARELPAADLDRILDELAGGDAYRRRVALFLAMVAQRSDRIEAALADPDHGLASTAAAHWLRRDATAETVGALLHDAPAETRARTYQRIRADRRTDLAEALIDQVRARFGDAEAAGLIVACGLQTVERLLPALWHVVGGSRGLAYRHPRAVLAEADRQLRELSRPRAEDWWRRYGRTVLTTRRAEPDAVLDLLERRGPAGWLPGDLGGYGALDRPERVVSLLTARSRARWLTGSRLPRALLASLAQLPPSGLAGLAQRLRDNETALASLLKAVPPRHRAELFDLAYADVDRRLARTADAILDVLPRAKRISEARRILALGSVRDDEELVLRYTAHLDWAEAEAVLTAASRRNAADQRAVGYDLLIACAARTREPAIVSTVVGRLVRLRNEQDPVRARALMTLSAVPAWLLEPAAAEPLGTLVADAVQARDSSQTTLHALSTIAMEVLRTRADSAELLTFAQQTLDRVYGGDRVPYLGRLDLRLRRGQEGAFFDAVRPWLESGVRRGEYGAVLALARGLHRRAWRVPELQALLEAGTEARTVASVAEAAIGLWLADPAHRQERLERVLARDESAAVLPVPWHVLCARRTDLLDRVLSGRPLKGRFVQRGVTWVPTDPRFVRRWLPRQHDAYAKLLGGLAADTGVSVHRRAIAIGAAARIPGSGPAIVHRYLDSAEVYLAEAALQGLPWSDPPEAALGQLLSHVDDDRARVATYAAGRVARRVAPSRAATALAAALGSRKVTSRKEALRILARLAVPGAGDVLTAAWRHDDQHRDVRAAVVSAARQRLDDPASWSILTEAAGAERTATLMLLEADPFGIGEAYRRRYAALIATACDSGDLEVSRAAWRAFPSWTQWTDDPGGAVVRRLVDLDDRTVWSRVVPALVSLIASGTGEPVAVEVLRRLAELDASADPAGGPADDRDRPAYRRIEAVVNALIAWSVRTGPDTDRSGLGRLGQLLAPRPELLPLGLRLLVHGVRFDSPQETLDGLDPVRRAGHDRPLATQVAAAELRARLAKATDAAGPVLAAAQTLAARADLASGLLAVALASLGERYGWSPPWRDLVRTLRTHPTPDTRTAALALVLAPER